MLNRLPGPARHGVQARDLAATLFRMSPRAPGRYSGARAGSDATSYGSRAAFQAVSVAGATQLVQLFGYATAGDGGRAFYKRVASEPAHEGKVRSVDRYLPNGTTDASAGGWWALDEPIVFPQMFGAPANGTDDDDPATQDAYDYLDVVGGGAIKFPRGDYVLSASVECTGNDVTTILDNYAQINHDTPDFMALRISGDRCTVVGGIARGFVGPAAWDAATGAVTPDYAVIQFTGEQGRVEGTRLFNIRRVGVQFKDSNNGTLTGCIIDGNQPSPTFPITLTVHFGVHLDPSTEASEGNYRITNTLFKNCTQGCMVANYGSGATARAVVVDGNIFEGMWDHGVYSNYTNGIVVSNNCFSECHIGVVTSGSRNMVIGNAFIAKDTSAGERKVSGVQIRDAQHCVVADNIFFGTLTSSSAICIDVGCFTTNIQNVIIANNNIRTVGRGIAIRLTDRSTGSAVITCTVEGNSIICEGRTGDGIIQIEGPSASQFGHIVRGNTISILGTGADGIKIVNGNNCIVADNIVLLDHDAGSAADTKAVHFSVCTACRSSGNSFYASASFGENVTFTGVDETGGTCLLNESINDRGIINSAKTGFSYVHLGPASGTTKLLAHYAGIGVPAATVRGGSIYSRVDGGAGTSFYVNEGDGNNWVPVTT